MNDKPWHDQSALELGAGIAAAEIDPVALTDHFLDRMAAEDPGHLVYIRDTAELAHAQAGAAALRVRDGRRLGPLDGVPICWKDLTDTKGITTTFASAIFADRVPDHDALLLQRANQAGLVCLGKTNLSEFAYSGLGINPIFGTPASAASGNHGARVPGGSSSGTGVAVGSGLAAAGIGSDTGGSVRIPAAFNGIVGLKTTWGRLPLDGIMALSPSLDTIGPLTQDVADANALFAVLDGSKAADLGGLSLRGVKLLAPQDIALDDLEDAVAEALATAMARLRAAGAEIIQAPVPEFTETFDVVAQSGNIISAEGYALWQDEFENQGDKMYWGILERFNMAKNLSGIEVARAPLQFAEIARRLWQKYAGIDAFIMPTTPIVPPLIEKLENDPAAYDQANIMSSRNTRLGNLLGACGLSMPCQAAGELPVGLMLMATPNTEGALLRLGKAVEDAL
jgi:aspartyl-tRNA(Asn)/glutamyl-tRNA(Gln) amidotransferase subunit A